MKVLPNRKFGIELEISRRLVNAGADERAKNNAWELMRRGLVALMEKGDVDRHWQIKPDSSCGGELVSPPLIGSDGLRQVGAICKWAKKFAKQQGKPLVDAECGLHLHFDASDMDPKMLSNIFILLHAIEPAIYTMYPDRNHRYCAPIEVNLNQAARFRDFIDVRDVWYRGSNNVKDRSKVYSSAFINQMQAGEYYDGTRYHGFNIHCYWSIGTIEFRYAPGTFDLAHIKSYYELCLSVITTAKKAADEGVKIPYLQGMNDKSYSQIMQNLQQGYRFRKYLIEVVKMINLPRHTTAFIVRRLRDVNDRMLEKDPSTTPMFIVDSNKDKYWFRCQATGGTYNHTGLMVAGNEMLKPRITVQCVREKAKNGDIILVPSGKNVKMDIVVTIEKASDIKKSQRGNRKAIYFYRDAAHKAASMMKPAGFNNPMAEVALNDFSNE